MVSFVRRTVAALRNDDRVDYVGIGLLAALFRAQYWQNHGTLVARDSYRYLEWCSDLSLGTLFGTRALVYSGYWLPYCGWLRATGWSIQGWIAVQFLLSSLICVLIYETGKRLIDRRAGLVAGGLFVFQRQVFYWLIRPQSEFMMTFVFTLALWRFGEYHLARTRRNRLFLLASLALVATVRPNGLPIVFGYLVYDFFPKSSDRRYDLFFSARANLAVGVALAAGALYRFWFGWARGSIFSPWKEGVIVTPDRLIYGYTPDPAGTPVGFVLANAEHLVVIALLRGVMFFSPVMPGWTETHAVRTAATVGPLMVGGALGLGRAVERDRHLLKLWGTPLVMMVLTAMATWVAGWRNFLGPAVVVYALFTGYFVSSVGPIRERLGDD